MTKKQIVDLFTKKGILSSMSGLVRRPFCWKRRFDKEAESIFNEFKKEYRSDDEAWFCLCRNIELPICPICGKAKVKFTGITKNGGVGYNTTCEHCSANALESKINKFRDSVAAKTDEEKKLTVEKRKTTNTKRYGEPVYMGYGSKSFSNLMLRRHGDEHYNNKDKARKTCLHRYGVSSNLQLNDTKKKAIENAWSDECRKRRIENCTRMTGKRFYTQVESVQKKSLESKGKRIHSLEMSNDCTLLADVTRRYGQGYRHLGLEYLRFGGNVFVQNKDIPAIEEYSKQGTHTNKYTSKPEKDVLDYVKSIYNGEVIENCTSVVPNGNHRFFELDIYIPALKLGIDFNGTYWHSTRFKDKMYHQRKTWCSRNVGVRLIHIFEDKWNEEREECKRIIKSIIVGKYENNLGACNEGTIGDNAYPIPEGKKVLLETEPILHQVGRVSYYDCGKVIYI